MQVNPFVWFLRAVYKIYCIFVFIFTFIPFYPFFHITLINKKLHPLAFKIKRVYALVLHTLGGIIIIIEKRGKLSQNTPYVICPNHSSYIDIALLYRVFDDYFVFMGKKEIEKVPLFGNFFRKEMNISVDRKSKKGSHAAFLRACEEVDKGNSIVIFPEATIPNCAPRLAPFKNGAFKLAIEKQIPIVPVTFTANWKRIQGSVLLKGKAGPGITKAIIHEPISTKGLTLDDLLSLKQQTFDTINEPLKNEY